MKILAIGLGICFALLVGVLGGRFWVAQRQLQDLHVERDQLRSQVVDLSGRMNELLEAGRQGEETLRTVSGEVKRLRAKLSEREAAEQKPRAPDPRRTSPQRIRAYLGREFVGEAWLIASRVGEDPVTGQGRFEPVAVLDEQSRKTFTVTNIVEREVVRTSTVNNTYLPPARTYYPVYYPVYPAQRQRLVDDRSHPVPAPPRPVLPNPPRGKSPW